MNDRERYREVQELDALFGVKYEIWDTKHLLEHFDSRSYLLSLLNGWYEEEFYFPDTQDKVEKMERKSDNKPFNGKEHIDYILESGFPLIYMEWDIPDMEDEDE